MSDSIISWVLFVSISDLSQTGNMKEIVLDSFNNVNEEVKSAASYALGNISLGNLKEYLPFVLHEIETQSKRQYLLLHSLKEVRCQNPFIGHPTESDHVLFLVYL